MSSLRGRSRLACSRSASWADRQRKRVKYWGANREAASAVDLLIPRGLVSGLLGHDMTQRPILILLATCMLCACGKVSTLGRGKDSSHNGAQTSGGSNALGGTSG